MTGSWITLAVELLVALLLAITIGYCVILNRRLTRLRLDETAMRATIGDLVRATDAAERAIAGLRQSVQDCDTTLAKRVREAEYFSIEIAREIGEGEQVLDRIMQITKAVRPAPARDAAEPVRPAPRMSEIKAKFAQSAERLAGVRRGLDGEAA